MPTEKSPVDLAAEMQSMADLHPNTIWAQAMGEGAAMILALVHQLPKGHDNG